MIKEDQLESALYSMHLILSELRSMAFAGERPDCIADVLDWAEAMPFLIANPQEDRTESFRNHILGVIEKHPRFGRVLAAFDANRGFYK